MIIELLTTGVAIFAVRICISEAFSLYLRSHKGEKYGRMSDSSIPVYTRRLPSGGMHTGVLFPNIFVRPDHTGEVFPYIVTHELGHVENHHSLKLVLWYTANLWLLLSLWHLDLLLFLVSLSLQYKYWMVCNHWLREYFETQADWSAIHAILNEVGANGVRLYCDYFTPKVKGTRRLGLECCMAAMEDREFPKEPPMSDERLASIVYPILWVLFAAQVYYIGNH